MLVVDTLAARAEGFYLGLFDQFPTPIWRAGRDARCNYFNRAWLEFTGRSMLEELGDGWVTGVHPDDVGHVMRDYLAAFEARRPFRLEYRLRRWDGQYRWLVDHGNPFSDLDGSFAGYIGSCYDITERKQAEELREQYIHAISHDLRNPLAVVQMNAEYLEHLAESLHLTSDVMRGIRAILRSSHTLRGLVDDLADVARLESGQLKLEPRVVDVGDFLRELVGTIGATTAAGRLTMDLPAELPPVKADLPRLERIVSNLIDNALKYSEGPVHIAVTTDAILREVAIAVTDRGPGIPPEVLPHIFERYRRGVHDEKGGLGLGLYIAKGLAEAHGGRIWVRSVRGEGTTFYLALPAAR